MLRFGLLLSFFTVFLQISVFLQALLPEKYQIAPVCETISTALSKAISTSSSFSAHTDHHIHSHEPILTSQHQTVSHDHHDPSHQCQYCTVYANLVLPPEHDIHEVLINIKVRFLWLQQQFEQLYFVLQRLFLLPQGRAPPVLI